MNSTLGRNVAGSDDMVFGLRALCEISDTKTRASIEEGLFRRHSAQTAIQNHLVSTGSLILTDEFGDWSTIDTGGTFPAHSNSCIAIDAATRRVFAVGGHEAGDAVDTIQVWLFDDDKLDSGEVVDSWRYDVTVDWSGLKLDKPRYGAMCHFYKVSDTEEFIVVINGMSSTDDANKRGNWFKDMKLISLHERPLFSAERRQAAGQKRDGQPTVLGRQRDAVAVRRTLVEESRTVCAERLVGGRARHRRRRGGPLSRSLSV